MKRIVINGANGYVASNFIKRLLALGYQVVALVRAGDSETSEQKMHNSLARLTNNAPEKYENLQVCDYSLLDPQFGLSPAELSDIFGGEIDYFHFAASLKYDEKSREEIFTTNIDGLKNSLDAFQKYTGDDSRFFFISTVYSCGKTSAVFEERFYDNEDISAFRNYYEQSKRFAENEVRKRIENDGLKAHVLRLSQVVGEHRTGVVKTDYGIFDFAKRIQNLAVRYPNCTIRLNVNPNATQNLIPIDLVVSYLMRMVEMEEVPLIINLAAERSTTNEHIINKLNEMLPVNLKPIRKLEQSEMSAIERVISVGMSFTGAYIDTNLSFDTTCKQQVMTSNGLEINEQSVSDMLEYFIESMDVPNKVKHHSGA